MHRVLSLLVVIAHIGAAAVPCVDTSPGDGAQATVGNPTAHSMLLASTRAEPRAARSPMHAEHGDPAQSGHGHGDPHGHGESSHTGTEVGGEAERKPQAHAGQPGAMLEMSAPCLCGCSKRTGSRGTVTPVAQTLASRPADTPLLVTKTPPVEERQVDLWPASSVDPPEHVPISS